MENTLVNFDTALYEFVGICQDIHNEWYKQYPNLTPRTIVCEPGSKFVRVVSKQGENHRSVIAFVAKVDGQTKALGAYKMGSVFKPATWKIPAKHVRGSIFSDSNGREAMERSGNVRYLR